MAVASLESRIKNRAHELGFQLAGIVAAGPAETFPQFRQWLDDGCAGEMGYLYRHEAARQHPQSVLDTVRSIVVVALNYNPGDGDRGGDAPQSGRVASYAHGSDYHDVIRIRLKELLRWIQTQRPECHGRAVVDTAPLLERDFARKAGLGWFGKNTMLIHPKLGSFFFIGALLLDCELEPDAPFATDHCGTCTACLDACPTDAFPTAGTLDSRRCISYLTIELRGEIDEALRAQMGDWVFGCDICQDVCPWNRKAPVAEPDSWPRREDLCNLDLIGMLALTEDEFRKRFDGTALSRPKRSGMLRNAAVALGNVGNASALPVLRRAMEDADEVVRDAARWAISQIETRFSAKPV